MNFLSHYYFYKSEDPYYNLGLVLPDLVKTFCKAHLKGETEFNNPYFIALNEGSLAHLQADKIFHNSNFFRNTSGLISELLDNESKWPRKWFLNHLLTEILLDRVLMDRNSELCEEFYNEIRKPAGNQVSMFLKLSGINNYQNFSAGFERFVSIAFISEYAHNEKIIFALNRVYNRVGIDYTFTEEDKTLLMRQMPDILKYINKNLMVLETELKK